MMHRFFTEKKNITGDNIVIRGEDVKHITKVLRLDVGDAVVVCDGDCTEYISKIAAVEGDCVRLTVENISPSDTEPSCKVDLYQGLPKTGKMESIIQKCVELGVNRIIAFAGERSVSKIEPKEISRKSERYNRVAYEAAKQSRRGRIPEVNMIRSLAEADFRRYDKLIVAYEDEKHITLKHALSDIPNGGSAAIFIGPEGGFEPSEVVFLKRRGATAVSLGPRILRTETAGMAMLAMIMYECEMESGL